MHRFVLKRLLQFVPTFIGITIITFILVQMAPGDPVTLQSEPLASGVAAQYLAEWHRLQGHGEPLWVRYGEWFWHFIRFDFGCSLIDERPVRSMVFEALPRTILLTGTSLLLIYGLSIPLGIHSALRRGTRVDRLVSGLLFALYSLPPFWVALILVVFLGGGGWLDLFPIRGLASDGLADAGWVSRGLDLVWHLVLPVACLTYPALARTSRFQRQAMLEVKSQDYLRTARAKGLSEHAVIWRHAVKNSLVPVLTLLTLDLPWLIGGSVIIERIFTIRGMGMLTFEAILRRDYPVIMGVTALAALLTMVAMLLADLLQAWIDPRVRVGVSR